jgi:CheY-like chemotaxis protein
MVILNEILDFSKIEAGQLSIERIAFNPREVITECLSNMEVRTASKGLTLAVQLPSDLPARMLGDPGRIRQVLTNLCDNAIKFTHSGGLSVRLQYIGDKVHGYEVRLSVTDTGVGIPESKQKLIFESFSQADTSTTRQFGGTGLGLAICARLVELMEGRIWVDSAPNQGSTFHFTVRLGHIEDVRPAPHALHAPTGTASAPRTAPAPLLVDKTQGQLLVLLAEDNPTNVVLFTALFKRGKHTLVHAENGQLAVDLFPTAAWDIVLMDMRMPVMGGIEATRLIRALPTLGRP